MEHWPLTARSSDLEDQDSEESQISVPDGAQGRPIGRNLYALLISEVTQDYVRFWKGTNSPRVRLCRIAYSVSLILAVLLLQIFLLYAIFVFLCEPSVKHIRLLYSKYEKTMYGDQALQSGGFWRGAEHAQINETAFTALSPDDQFKLCNFPLSQPVFTGAIILIWTLTCVAEIRSATNLALTLLWSVPKAEEVSQCMTHGEKSRTIVGLTRVMKAGLLLGCFLPRVLAAMLLNYLGCRWIVSSTDLSALFLDSLALEFIVLLPELLYRTFASERSMLSTESTFVQPGEMSGVSAADITAVATWGLLSLFWTVLYMASLQQVLPGYRWDVHSVCQKYADILIVP